MPTSIKPVSLTVSIEIDSFMADMPNHLVPKFRELFDGNTTVIFASNPSRFIIRGIPASMFSYVYGIAISLLTKEVNEIVEISIKKE